MGDRTHEDTAEHQRITEGSWLKSYKELIRIRGEYLDPNTSLRWTSSRDSGVLAYRRGDTISALNVDTDDSFILLPEGEWEIVFQVGVVTVEFNEVTFGVNSAAILTLIIE